MQSQRRSTLPVLRVTAVVTALLCLTLHAAAQLPQIESFNTNSTAAEGKVPEYDVVSVKVHKPSENMMRMKMLPDGFEVDNITAKNLVANAYGLRPDLVSGGPGWMSSAGYDVQAKVAGPDVEQYKKLSAAQRRSMMQALLADRFQMKSHMETKELPIYDLVVAKGGVKMEAAPAPPPPAEGTAAPAPGPGARPMRIMMGPDKLEIDGATTGMLASQLSGSLHTTVVDKTGLTGRYNLKLHWTPEDAPAHTDNGADAPPSIFTAVQEQLGLKLQPAKGPVQTVVIDHAELPTEN